MLDHALSIWSPIFHSRHGRFCVVSLRMSTFSKLIAAAVFPRLLSLSFFLPVGCAIALALAGPDLLSPATVRSSLGLPDSPVHGSRLLFASAPLECCEEQRLFHGFCTSSSCDAWPEECGWEVLVNKPIFLGLPSPLKKPPKHPLARIKIYFYFYFSPW